MKHKKYREKNIQNILLQNLLAEILEIWYVTLSSSPLPNLFKIVPGLQVKYIYKNLIQAQLLEIWYVALSCGLNQACSNSGPGSKMGVLGLNYRNTQENIEIFVRTTCLKCIKFGMASVARGYIG